MSVRRKTAIYGPPLTTAEDSGVSLVKVTGRPITCYKCGKGGGTLVKVDDQYKHTKC